MMQPRIINKQVKLSFVASLIDIIGGIHSYGFIENISWFSNI